MVRITRQRNQQDTELGWTGFMQAVSSAYARALRAAPRGRLQPTTDRGESFRRAIAHSPCNR